MSTIINRNEAADYYFKYINRVAGTDICAELESQAAAVLPVLESIGEERSLYRYAAGKWSIKELLAHMIDCERLFVFRAMWFARAFDSPLPSFDQVIANQHAAADARPWTALVEEFRHLRQATIAFYRSLPADAWARRGIASDNPVTVRALAYITAGHVSHHLEVLRSHYL